ncbi:MAG TPA: hypothetical protein PLD14_02710 [Candidatus Pacearchaeota archaeon]|nr:hypothetical protein [Candidatus Pacearchaeota archaeon]HPR80112.1 hypothetical protein [Candidatus Pacearchaeota archaeon]
MTKTKTIMTIYLYVVSLISLIFFAVGTGTLINTALKAYVFPEVEKRDYGMCINQPYFYSAVDAEKLKQSSALTVDEKTQIDNMIRDYENWKATNTGDACIKSERQKRMLDAITMILIAFPLYIIHWKMARKERQEADS